jgi:hypothetical protein
MGTTKQADTLSKVRISDELYAKLQIEARGSHRSITEQLAAVLAEHYAAPAAPLPTAPEPTALSPVGPAAAPAAPPPANEARKLSAKERLRAAILAMSSEELSKLTMTELNTLDKMTGGE